MTLSSELKELLSKYEEYYYLNTAKDQSSPATKISTGLIMDFIKHRSDTFKPFFLSVPTRETFIIKVSLGILLNLFFEDHIYNQKEIDKYIDPNLLKRGCKIVIFENIIANFQEKKENGIEVLFRGSEITKKILKKNIFPYVKLCDDQNCEINTVKQYEKQKAIQLANNDLHTLLNLNSDEILVPESIKSKIWFAAGRGNIGITKKYLTESYCIKQKTSDTFKLDENFIVKADLSELTHPSHNKNNSDLYFINELDNILSEIYDMLPTHLSETVEEIYPLINKLRQRLNDRIFDSNFIDIYNSLSELVSEEEAEILEDLMEYMPVSEKDIYLDLKLVIVSGISLYEEYKLTINSLIKRSIPVVVITDRFELSNYSIELDGYRFYWNKEKLMSLPHENSVKYADELFWQTCMRYANQSTSVDLFRDDLGDSIFRSFEQNKYFSELAGFENLKKLYNSILRPALYLLKNTPDKHPHREQIIQYVSDFRKALSGIDASGLDAELAEDFLQATENLVTYKLNPKHLHSEDNVFIQYIRIGGDKKKAGIVPGHAKRTTDISSVTEQITFSGYPYRDFKTRRIQNAIFNQNITNIRLLFWPSEWLMTSGILRQAFRNSMFTDDLPESMNIPKEIIFDQKQLNSEISNSLVVNYVVDKTEHFRTSVTPSLPISITEEKYELIQQKMDDFRFAAYTKKPSDQDQYVVEVNILHFENGDFMFLPKKRRVRVLRKNKDSQNSFFLVEYNDLIIGDIVVAYSINRTLIRQLTFDKLDETYEKMDEWRRVLEQLYLGEDSKAGRLSEQLFLFKKENKLEYGNPEHQNIIRWLKDKELLAPQRENVRLFLAFKFGLLSKELENKLISIYKARLILKRKIAEIDKTVKNDVLDKIKLEKAHGNYPYLKLSISGVSIDVKYGVLTEKENCSGVEISPDKTRKFITD